MPLTNAQYDEIMRNYERRRFRAEEEAEMRRARIFEQEPRLSDLDREIAGISVSRAKQAIAGDRSALPDLDRQIRRILRQKQEIFEQLGIREEDLLPAYSCPICRDTGYAGNQKCRCLKQAEADYLYARSNLRDILEQENFSTFRLDYYPEDLIDPDTGMSARSLAKTALLKCRGMIDQFDVSPLSLFFSGSTGTGKTFLTNCIAKELLDRGCSVIYFTACEIFEILSGRIFDRSTNPDDYNNIFSCDLLIIDDLGTEITNAVTVSQFFHCMNERILSRKPMLISTNLSLREIANIYSERISSRITEHFTPVRLYGRDIRIQKKLQSP